LSRNQDTTRSASEKLRAPDCHCVRVATRPAIRTEEETCHLGTCPSALSLGRVKTKSDLVVMLSGRQIFAQPGSLTNIGRNIWHGRFGLTFWRYRGLGDPAAPPCRGQTNKRIGLAAFPPTHHRPLPRIAALVDGITVHRSSQRVFCNTIPPTPDVWLRRSEPTLRARKRLMHRNVIRAKKRGRLARRSLRRNNRMFGSGGGALGFFNREAASYSVEHGHLSLLDRCDGIVDGERRLFVQQLGIIRSAFNSQIVLSLGYFRL
jgi:hypothetical protein